MRQRQGVAESLWNKGGFHALKGYKKGAGVSNIMIPPIIDYFCACPPITVSLCESRTSSEQLCLSGSDGGVAWI